MSLPFNFGSVGDSPSPSRRGKSSSASTTSWIKHKQHQKQKQKQKQQLPGCHSFYIWWLLFSPLILYHGLLVVAGDILFQHREEIEMQY